MNTITYDHKNGKIADMIEEYIKTHDNTNSPIFGDKEIDDIVGLVLKKTEGVLDPKELVIYSIYAGLAWAEKGF